MPKGNPGGYGGKTYGTNAKGKPLTAAAAAKKRGNRMAKQQKRGQVGTPIPLATARKKRSK